MTFFMVWWISASKSRVADARSSHPLDRFSSEKSVISGLANGHNPYSEGFMGRFSVTFEGSAADLIQRLADERGVSRQVIPEEPWACKNTIRKL